MGMLPPRGAGGRGAPPFRRRVALLASAAVLALAVAGGSAWAIYKIDAANSDIVHLRTAASCPPGDATCIETPALNDGRPPPKCFVTVCNYLILGSDSRAGLSKRQQSSYGSTTTVGGQRSDTIMLVQVNMKRGWTTILSIPRDLYVDIPGHGYNKINVAFDYGPTTTIRTVEALTGVTINHYVDVDFVGFMDLVNAIGGVPICVSQAMHDSYSGLNLPHPGCYTLKGPQALAFVRARHLPNEAIPDFSRIARQQQFMRAVMARITNPLVSVTNFNAILAALHKGVVIDQAMNLYDLQDLSRRLDSIGQSGVQFRSVPAYPFTLSGIDYVRPVQPEAGRIFAKLRRHQPLGALGRSLPGTPPSPATITVQVRDAGDPAMAARVQALLTRAGFQVLPAAPAPAGPARSRIVYARDSVTDEVGVVSAYLQDVRVTKMPSLRSQADVVVVVAPGFRLHF